MSSLQSSSAAERSGRGQKRVASPRATAGEWLGRKRSRTSSRLSSSEEEEAMEDELDEEEEFAELSQIQSQDMREFGQEKPVLSQKEAEAGVIDRIQLINFMCHRKLDVTLSANTNFILGRNGSGKSAIMTAIVVALGGKATTTHRASSLRNFIRTGAKSAEVIITMRNRGLDGYKIDEYGDSVTVHRTIRDDGSTAYKIKAADGSTVSTKKEDLVSVLDHWNIQVDNPVSLLDQDTSRHFLHSNNPTHKYKLFVKATRLEQIQLDYERAQEDQAIMKKSIERNQLVSEDLKKEAKVLEERLQLFDRLREMEDKVRRLEMELQWAMVMELERAIPPLEDQLEKARARLPRNQLNITKAEAKKDELDGLCVAVGKELEEVVREAQEVSQRRTEKTLERKRVEREVRDVKLRQRTTRGAIEDQSREKAALQQKMEDLIALSQQNTAGERARRQQMVQEAEQELCELRGELTDLSRLKSDLEKTVRDTEDRKRQVEGQKGQLKRELTEGGRKVEMLQSSRSDQLLAYGEWMPRLVAAIRAAQGRFRKPPKGPIGTLFKLHDYRWSTAIESILTWNLSAFVVDNTYDGKTLEDIIKHELHGQRSVPDVLVSKYTGRPYDVSRKKPQTHHPTVLDMMEVEDLEVRNLLIDQCHVDTVLLIERRVDAEHVIEVERPRGASVAHTIEGDQILAGRFYANKKRPLGIIRESVDRAIEEEQRRLRELETQLYNVERNLTGLQKESAMSKEKEASVRRKLSSVNRKKSQVEMNLKELRSAEEEEESQEDIATYESEIQECQTRIDEMMEKKRDQDRELSELKAKLESYTVSLSTVESEAEQVTGKMEETKAKHSEYECERQKAESVLHTYRVRVTEIEGVISSVEKKLSAERRRAQQAADDATKVCERVETKRTCKSIQSEITKFRHRIEQEEPQASEKEAIAREYTSKVELYQDTMGKIRDHNKALRELRKGLVLRLNQYSQFQETITDRACIYFKHFLQRRDYDGDLKFNHNKGTLTMEVRVDSYSKRSQSTKNTKSLSGGERSFTTVCFIMSLWEAIDSPFRCLDEFDVFMDMVNRRISMKLMLECSSEQRGKQFIFLTPQDMSQMGVEMGPHIKVLKLRPPERTQSTLD